MENIKKNGAVKFHSPLKMKKDREHLGARVLLMVILCQWVTRASGNTPLYGYEAASAIKKH
jgi:hypothetical protein